MSFKFSAWMRQFDSFGQALPGFNLKGQSMVNTNLGGAMTIMLSAIVLVYAIAKSFHLQSVRGQTISTYTDDSTISPTNPFNLNERDMLFAVALPSLALDQRYVKTVLTLTSFKEG